MRYRLHRDSLTLGNIDGEYYDTHLIRSLDDFFQSVNDEEIDNFIDDGMVGVLLLSVKGPYYGGRILRINDVADKDSMLEFTILHQLPTKMYLTFTGRMKG